MIGLDRAVAYVRRLDFFGFDDDDIVANANAIAVPRDDDPDDRTTTTTATTTTATTTTEDDLADAVSIPSSETTSVRACGSPRSGNRKADARRVIATYTRAFLRASRVVLPRKNGTTAEKIEGGHDAFLRWAYGSSFDVGGRWHEASNPRAFFEHLLGEHADERSLSRPLMRASLATIEDVFRKKTPARHSSWVIADDVERRFGIVANDLTRVAENMRGKRFTRLL